VLRGDQVVFAGDVVYRRARLSQCVGALVNCGLRKEFRDGLKQRDAGEVSSLLAPEQGSVRVKGFAIFALPLDELRNNRIVRSLPNFAVSPRIVR
jgi:hypothetical protein